MNWAAVAEGSIPTTLAGVAYYIFQITRDARGDRRATKREARADSVSFINAQQTALDAANKRNDKLVERTDELEAQVDQLRQAHTDMRDHYEAEIERLRDVNTQMRRRYEQEVSELRDQLNEAVRQVGDVTRRLDALQRQLHPSEDDE